MTESDRKSTLGGEGQDLGLQFVSGQWFSDLSLEQVLLVQGFKHGLHLIYFADYCPLAN